MTRLVLDASVIVKWIFPDDRKESNVAQALSILQGIKEGTIRVLQPPHWLAEVAAVVSRLAPEQASEAVGLLYAMELPILDEPEVYIRACELSALLDHHVFDTLYHAVALCQAETIFLTADMRYHRKAFAHGSIGMLRDFSS